MLFRSAKRYLTEGAKVVIADINHEKGEAAKDEIGRASCRERV